jgi:hypothetical protein
MINLVSLLKTVGGGILGKLFDHGKKRLINKGIDKVGGSFGKKTGLSDLAKDEASKKVSDALKKAKEKREQEKATTNIEPSHGILRIQHITHTPMDSPQDEETPQVEKKNLMNNAFGIEKKRKKMHKKLLGSLMGFMEDD